MRFIKALLAAGVLAALVVAPPWALLRYIGNPWPTEGVSLSAPLTDGAIIGLLAVVVWILWAQLMACIAVEAMAALTDDRVRLDVPFALGVQQHLARRLITAVVIATVATPIAAGFATAAAASSSAATTHRATPSGSSSGPDGRSVGVEQDQAREGEHTTPQQREHHTARVTVMRLDSLWSIAERYLGDGARWPEIAALNRGLTMNDGTTFVAADHIKPGWELRVPAEGAGPDTGAVTVRPGDTLSEIAEETTGDADNWVALYKANESVVGDDPDLVRPGQVLVLPGASAVSAIEDRLSQSRGHQRGDADGSNGNLTDGRQGGAHWGSTDHAAGQDQPTAHSTSPSAVASQAVPSQAEVGQRDPSAAQQAPAEAGKSEDEGEDEGEMTALRALLASAVCLSVGSLGLLAANRRRQFRSRRIGRTIASTPEEFTEVEQALVESGASAQADVEFLDRALRHVSASCKATDSPLPQLGAAVLGEEDLTLLFTQSAAGEVPEGWTATEDARAWILPRETLLEEDLETQPAPYPALVSVGLDESGRTWMLDLETLGTFGVGGEPQQVADLIRFMVAELAVNSWAEGCEVLLADQFAAETIRLNPGRLRQVTRSDALARAAVLASEMGEVEQNLNADVLTRRRDGLLLDTAHPVVVVLASRPEGEFVSDIEPRDRSRVVLVHADEETPVVELGVDGMAFLPMWGISVKAFTIGPEHAAPMADLLTATRNLEDQPVPATQSDDGPLGKYARADGSLREEYTGPRHTEGNDPTSQLPEADEVYIATAATTPEDLAAGAPSVPAEIRAETEALDPRLDQDVADWFDGSSQRPKVHLLGPVEVTSLNGGDPSAIGNLSGTVSFIAYLAVQDHGVTAERVAAAFGWKTVKTVQNRATNARSLLGTRPDGTDWLPDASMSAGARRGTSPTYELVQDSGGVLTSADLFVRLKFRAQKRGDHGCEEDLRTALSLVTGPPFEAASEHRFKWLFQAGQQRHDEILVGAIHDAAHVLATRAIAEGRTDLVRLACETSQKASPHSDIPWLDQAAATEAESGRGAAGELVREKVLDLFDEDLPVRSETIVGQREWGATG